MVYLDKEITMTEKKTSVEGTVKNPLKNISFSSNSAVSRDLKAWVSARSGSVHDARWDVIWSNTRDSIHYIRVKKDSGNVMYVFVTYLDNKRNPESVFDIDNQCWLYLAE
jgi:hypothetical protein